MSASDSLNPAATAAAARAEWRAGWRAVAGVSIGLACGYPLWLFTVSQFIAPWEAAFGWTRGEITLGANAMILSALLSPLVGRLTDRIGVRRVMLPGFLLLGLFFLSGALLDGSLLGYYVWISGLTVAGTLTTGVVLTRVIAARFAASRGLALAVSRIGMAISGSLMPPLVFAAIAASGWQWGFVALAGVTLLIGLPVCYVWVREDGGAASPAKPGDRGEWRRFALDRRFLLLVAAGVLLGGSVLTVLHQMQALLTSKQIDAATAAGIGGLFAGATLLGAMVSGILVDRVWAPLVGFLSALGSLIGVAMLLTVEPSVQMAGAAVVLIGIAYGAEIDVNAYIIARYFGLRAYATLFGILAAAIQIANAVGAALFGQIFDAFGDYQFGLIGCFACLVGAAAAYLMLGPYPRAAAPDPGGETLQPAPALAPAAPAGLSETR